LSNQTIESEAESGTALGAALTYPDRRSIAFEADESGLCTLQALWSIAREGVDVTVVVCANRRYRILQTGFSRAGFTKPRPKARALTDLARPVIDWDALARGSPSIKYLFLMPINFYELKTMLPQQVQLYNNEKHCFVIIFYRLNLRFSERGIRVRFMHIRSF
jgi:hypothetical protein